MRNVYFAFHYERDIFRVNRVRNSGLMFGSQSVGFADRSLWEKTKLKGSAALERMIINGLKGTSATVVLIGKETASRKWVNFEIAASLDRRNAVIGVRIHHLKFKGKADARGAVPPLLKAIGAPIHEWNDDPHALGDWVEDAIETQWD